MHLSRRGAGVIQHNVSWENIEPGTLVEALVTGMNKGGLELQGKQLWVVGGRVACTRFDADHGVLSVSFRLAVQDGEYGRQDEADGVAHCVVQSPA